ncbi:MAG: class I SAM-dependent rRNA methyltransferase [Bacteroidales bacterium]|nr:class I SAM-dependent rRNA methyltransferase [Bacteroidales bacterium]MBQ9701564.1 class I SAM-dependent rRNA methyltransferase [Bacteroidales bacterium]MBR1781916.1 class I SAM-dependent rRNA methyltransferase [Bacteroidales bacterium]
MDKIILKHGREESLLRYHPWVFSGAVAQIVGHPAEGDLVSVCSADGQLLCCGHYQVGSIAVRVLSFDEDPTKADYWLRMLKRAYKLREAYGLATSAGTTCYRLVHGEGDGLPGLIIDYYDGVCVLQAHSVGMFRAKAAIAQALRELYRERLKAVYDKSSGTAPFKAGLELVDGYLYKAPGFEADELAVLENGNRFLVNWCEGQKTGFFLDQRENRARVGALAAGRKVLNLFCYTGGFSIYALAGGALHVDSVDSSQRAMDMVDRNVALNGFGADKHTSYCTDAIDFVKNVPDGAYDLMIVDPPAFAKHRGAFKNALRAYQRLNAAAIAKVAPGGFVFTFSCSQVVDKEAFALAVFSAAAQTGRSVRILDRLNQPADHSVNIYHPEGEYLKGLLLYVE